MVPSVFTRVAILISKNSSFITVEIITLTSGLMFDADFGIMKLFHNSVLHSVDFSISLVMSRYSLFASTFLYILFLFRLHDLLGYFTLEARD